MGRKQRKLVQLKQAQQAKAFFEAETENPDLQGLSRSQKRSKIAKMCSDILASPELNHSKFKVLLILTEDPDVKSIAFVSLTALFIDIAPGYSIKSKQPEHKQISKEVRALRAYEGLLLKYYSQFLSILKSFSKNNLGGIKCLCRLLQKLPHFNYAKDLICFLVRHLHAAPGPILEAFEIVLRSKECDSRFQVVKQLHHWFKATSYKSVPVEVVDMLSRLELTQLEVSKPSKRPKLEEEVDKDLAEAEATVSTDEIAKSNLKVLKEILAIYFRVIKHHPKSPLFPAVLKGLSRYAEHINTELVRDLVKHLSIVMADDELPPEHSLQAIHAVLRITRVSAGVLALEDRLLSTALYKSLLHLPASESHSEALLGSLSQLLLQKRHYSVDLVMAFAKRMLQVAYHCSRPLMQTLIYFVKILVNTYPKLASRLQDDEEETYSSGYAPEAEDPALVQAADFNWELKALSEFEPRLCASLSNRNWTDDLSKTPVKFYQAQLAAAFELDLPKK